MSAIPPSWFANMQNSFGGILKTAKVGVSWRLFCICESGFVEALKNSISINAIPLSPFVRCWLNVQYFRCENGKKTNKTSSKHMPPFDRAAGGIVWLAESLGERLYQQILYYITWTAYFCMCVRVCPIGPAVVSFHPSMRMKRTL